MRAISLSFAALVAAALATPAVAEPALDIAADGYVLLARKGDKERGRGQSGREDRPGRESHEQRGGYEEDQRSERRRISREEAAQRAQRRSPGRVLGVDESHGEAESGYEVKILDGGRLRVIRVPSEDD